MLLVTGGAGFIGSHLVAALNARGDADVLVVDNLERGDKFKNLADCQIADYLDKRELFELLRRGRPLPEIRGVFHLGACTDTLEADGRYLMENNFTFSKLLLRHALETQVPFVYASSAAVYGHAQAFAPQPANERPLNVYGYSKLVFDQHVRRLLRAERPTSSVVGLRYFNVYGPREAHKGRMASMVYQVYRQLREQGKALLYEGFGGFADGEQRRDFVFVEDVVRATLHMGLGPRASSGEPSEEARQGIVNVGSGVSVSFNDLARALVRLLGGGEIAYVPCAPQVQPRYQGFTEADLGGLRALGYSAPFMKLEEGLRRSLPSWGPHPELLPQRASA